MNLSKFFIDRPIFAGVLSLLIFIGGLLSIRALPISEYPDVVPPSVVVRAQYPGANPKVIAETVAAPLERRFGQIPGINEITSSSALGSATPDWNDVFLAGINVPLVQEVYIVRECSFGQKINFNAKM